MWVDANGRPCTRDESLARTAHRRREKPARAASRKRDARLWLLCSVPWWIACGALLWWATGAQAAEQCALREQVISKLRDGFSERQQSLGLMDNGSILELYANEDTGTWTVIQRRPDGQSCLMASGQMFEGDVQPLGPEGDPT